jgi:FkbM family methyltransferase
MKKTIKQILIRVFGINFLKNIQSKFKSSEEQHHERARKEFYSQFLTKGDIYFDVGSNYGNRIEPVIDIGLKIVAVEPQEKCVRFLKNKYGNRITIINKGLSSKIEDRTMYLSDAHVLSSFSEEFIQATRESGRFEKYTWKKGSTIQMTTLDELIATYGLPKFIKIDVEGFELEVLKGLSQRVEYISYEFTVPEQRTNAVLCLERIGEIADKDVECNYSVGENMQWALPAWISFTEFRELLNSDLFYESNFGDIYIKTNLR